MNNLNKLIELYEDLDSYIIDMTYNVNKIRNEIQTIKELKELNEEINYIEINKRTLKIKEYCESTTIPISIVYKILNEIKKENFNENDIEDILTLTQQGKKHKLIEEKQKLMIKMAINHERKMNFISQIKESYCNQNEIKKRNEIKESNEELFKNLKEKIDELNLELKKEKEEREELDIKLKDFEFNKELEDTNEKLENEKNELKQQLQQLEFEKNKIENENKKLKEDLKHQHRNENENQINDSNINEIMEEYSILKRYEMISQPMKKQYMMELEEKINKKFDSLIFNSLDSTYSYNLNVTQNSFSSILLNKEHILILLRREDKGKKKLFGCYINSKIDKLNELITDENCFIFDINVENDKSELRCFNIKKESVKNAFILFDEKNDLLFIFGKNENNNNNGEICIVKKDFKPNPKKKFYNSHIGCCFDYGNSCLFGNVRGQINFDEISFQVYQMK